MPPMNGLRLQVSALVREFQNEHEVRVLARRMPGQVAPAPGSDMRLIETKRPMTRWVSVTTGEPPGTVEPVVQFAKPLREELRGFDPDVVHVTSGRLALLGGMRLLRGRPIALAALDAWHLNVQAEAESSVGAMRWLRRIEGTLVRRFERRRYKRFDRVIVVSEEDRRALLEVNPDLRIEVIPNGVDADSFDWDGTPRDRGVVLFTGVLSYAPNVTACTFLARRVLPHLHEAVPGARLLLVGRHPAPEVQSLAGLPGVEVVGEVPDMRPWLSRAGAYACPMLSGTGIKNKLLEAMANGAPCVVTPLALQGLSATPDHDFLQGSTAEEVAKHLERLLLDPTLADRVGAAGRAYVRTHHTWAAASDAYLRIYREVTRKDSP